MVILQTLILNAFWAIDTHLDFDVANSSDQRTYSQLSIPDAKIARFLLSLDQRPLQGYRQDA